METKQYYVYIVTNPGKTVFYTGVTNDIKRRLKEHRANKETGEHFTGKYCCHKLIYYETFKYILDAIKREKEIKGLLRSEKMELIKSQNPKIKFYDMW